MNRILVLATTAAAVAGAVATVVLSVRNSELRREVASAARYRAATADSLRLARDYKNLLAEVFDLQQEVRARQIGEIPPLLTSRAQGVPIGALLGARVVPDKFRFEPTVSERERARVALAREPSDELQARLYIQQDVLDSGALAPLIQRGAQVEVRRGEDAGPTNTITFGAGVGPREAVSVAYRLIASGILVRRIRRSANPADRQTIVLSHARYVSEWPELTVAELSRFAAAPPQP